MRRIKVLVIFLFIGNESFPTIQMDGKSPSKKLGDVTDPLDAFMQGQTSNVDFFTKSGFVETGTETKTKLNLYSPYCSTIQDCFDEINTVGRYWNDTLGRDLIDLTMSITLNNNTLAKLSNYNKRSVKLKTPNFRTNYLLNIDKTMTCDDLSNRRPGLWNLLNLLELTERDWGIGINEALLNCQAAADQIYERKWAVVYFKFGDTVGIPESFGIFRKRMAYMHAKIAKDLQKNTRYHEPTLPEIWYYPTVEAVGDENHYRLFENYMERWQDDGINGMQLIFRTKLVSSTQNGFDEASKSLVVSYITYTKDSWYAPSIVREFSKHFKIIILEYDGWKLWKLNRMEAPYNSDGDNLPPLDNKIEVIIDYSFAIEDGIVNANEELIQDILEVLQHINSMEPFVLKSILFDIKLQEGGNYSAQIDKNIGLQITSHGVDVGCVCVFLPELPTKSVAAGVVQACKEINGTLYILNHQGIYLRIGPANSFYYENNVRKVLESAKELRNLILKFHPAAKVYLELRITSNVDLHERDYVGVTSFCNEKNLGVNEYYEAIMNWAKFNDFPVIVKSAVDSLKKPPDYSSWLSLLRPTFWEGSREYQPKMAELYPLSVLRNYPIGINNWTVDPCINWMTRRPEIGVDYFFNKHVGTVFDTRYIRQNDSIQSEEYEILVSFISHRFNLAEIILSDKWQGFTTACNEFTSKLWNGPEKNYFISYVFADIEYVVYIEYVSIQELSQSATFLKFLNEIPSEGKCAVQGVHIDLSNYGVQVIINDTRIVKTLVEKRKELGMNIGVLLNSTECMDAFQLKFFRNVSIPYILTPINYLVCKEKYMLTRLDDVETIGKVLETHLYLKRVCNELQPNLVIYFRIEVDVVLDEDQTVMERYLRLISHFKEFGKAYDVSYFVVQAFDEEIGRRNGWWTNYVYTNLSNPLTYVEKESVYAGREMWRPLPLGIRPKIPMKEEGSEISLTVIVVRGLGAILIIGLIAVSSFLYIRYKKVSQFLSDEEVMEFLNGRSGPIDGTGQQTANNCASIEYMKFRKDYDLQLPDCVIDQQCLLGTGNFGVVYKGTAKGILAAIKQPNKNCTVGSFKSFLQEIKVHCYIGVHTNIVGFLGAYMKEIHKGTLLIATELCPNGSLETLLRRKRTVVSRLDQNEHVNQEGFGEEETLIEIQELHRFSLEIASGMDYLEVKQVVHGDLATRNVLLNENYTCKIGDFGLSRKLYEYQKYVKKSQEPLPWKWMSYESLTKMEFTSKSDVWSYGVTLWEIFSLGKIPYGAMNWTLEFPDELQNGLRLGNPEFSSEQIYGKMLECWNLDIERRPKFSELVEFFREIGNVDYTVLGD